jgi:hypothetical protein
MYVGDGKEPAFTIVYKRKKKSRVEAALEPQRKQGVLDT